MMGSRKLRLPTGRSLADSARDSSFQRPVFRGGSFFQATGNHEFCGCSASSHSGKETQ